MINDLNSNQSSSITSPCSIILNDALRDRDKSKRFVFLDRDGVININRDDYVKSWDEFVFIQGSKEAIKLLNDNNFWIILVTNQSPIGRGIFSHETLEKIHDKMLQELYQAGAHIDAIYYCPHSPDDKCECRKPKPGLLTRAAEELDIDLKSSILVGDSDGDLEAGNAVGCKTFKVTETNDLLQVVKLIIEKDQY